MNSNWNSSSSTFDNNGQQQWPMFKSDQQFTTQQQGWQAGGQQWNIPSAPSAAGFNNRSRSWNGSRRSNLRTHNWGQRSENGWSGFNNWKYQPQNLSSWERPSAILTELRSQNSQSRGFSSPLSAPILSAPILSAPISAAPMISGPATIVPVNMLPAPINDGAKYQKLIGANRGSRRYRKHLKQPLNNNAFASPLAPTNLPMAAQPAGLSALGSGLLNRGYGLPAQQPAAGLSRKQRKATKKQNRAAHKGSLLTPLGTSATSGLTGLPAAAPLNSFGAQPAAGRKLSRKERKALKKNNSSLAAPTLGGLGGNVLPYGLPVNSAIPVTNVVGSPILSAAAPAPFIKTAPAQTISPLALGRSAF